MFYQPLLTSCSVIDEILKLIERQFFMQTITVSETKAKKEQ